MRSEALRKEKKMRRNNIIIGIILLALMIFSMFAVYFSNPSNNISQDLEYNGYTFAIENVQGGQMFSVVVEGQKYIFYSLPADAKRIMENKTGISELSSSGRIIFVNEPLGLNSQVSSDQLYFDLIVKDLKTLSGKQILSGISEEDSLNPELVVYNCEDAYDLSPVLTLRKGVYSQMNITEVSDNCFEITSDTMSLLILRDYLIYRHLGILI